MSCGDCSRNTELSSTSATFGTDRSAEPFQGSSIHLAISQGCPTNVGQPWAALHNAFSIGACPDHRVLRHGSHFFRPSLSSRSTEPFRICQNQGATGLHGQENT